MAKHARRARRLQRAAGKVRNFLRALYGTERMSREYPDWRELWRLVRAIR